MVGKTHETATALFFALGITSGYLTNTLPLLGFTFGCLYGTLVPDIDAVNYSKARSYFPITRIIFDTVKKITPTSISRKYFKHRGIMHHVFFPLLFLLLALFLPVPYFVKTTLFGLGCGWFSHVVLDGVQKFTKCKSGGFLDKMIRYAMWASSVALLGFFLWEEYLWRI